MQVGSVGLNGSPSEAWLQFSIFLQSLSRDFHSSGSHGQWEIASAHHLLKRGTTELKGIKYPAFFFFLKDSTSFRGKIQLLQAFIFSLVVYILNSVVFVFITEEPEGNHKLQFKLVLLLLFLHCDYYKMDVCLC